MSFIDLKRNDSVVRGSLGRLSKNYLSVAHYAKFLNVSEVYFNKISKINDSLGLGNYYFNKGNFFVKIRVYDSAVTYLSKSEKIFYKLKKYEKLGIVLTKKSFVQLNLDDYLGAELSSEKAYKYFEISNSKKNMIYSLMTLGTSYQNMKEYDKAVLKFKEALIFYKKNKNHIVTINSFKETCLNNIGNAYREQEKYQKAISYFLRALKTEDIENKDPELYACLLNNLGFCYLKTNAKKKTNAYFEKAKKIFDNLNIKNESAVSDLYLSEYYSKNKDLVIANQYAEAALKKSKEANAPYYYLTALTQAGSINPKKAPLYIQEFKRVNDSLLFAERTARNQYYKIQLETEEINQEKETALKQRTYFVIIAGAVFLIAILIVIIARQRLKQKELRLQHAQQSINEEIYQLMLVQNAKEEAARQKEKKRIGLELHDGVMNKLTSTRLNLSVLSIKKDTETVEKCLPYINNIKEIENEIRNLTHNLNQKTSIYDTGFEKLLTDLITEQNQISSVQYQLEVDSIVDWEKITEVQKMNLYRILQESCRNINKHAFATKALIHFAIQGEKLHLTISDDGVGIQTDNTKKGIGLKNIKHRVKELNGKFNVISKTNQGTTLSVSIPLKN
ncbi:tetratricopeptide repeat-containing sensor histidine kinase [Flavobacterium mekongense]|uniref:tetratricopeptide repeat-containing sensor histidine kinase n=1 Tax=Flavobacterium mekongense TaxID=3379707 RepID=UPI00399B780D